MALACGCNDQGASREAAGAKPEAEVGVDRGPALDLSASGASAPDTDTAEIVELRLRTPEVQLGDALRVHVVVRVAGDLDLDDIPAVAITSDTSLAIELVGSERLDDSQITGPQDGPGTQRVRFDFRVVPSAAGTFELRPVLSNQAGAGTLEPATLEVSPARSRSEAAALLATDAAKLERGRSLTRQGDYRQAIEVFQLALETRRDDPTVLSELGWSAFLAGRLPLARRATRAGLRHALGSGERRGALLYNLGRIAEGQSDPEQAVSAYRRSLAVRPGNSSVSARLLALGADPWPLTCAQGRCVIASDLDPVRVCEIIEEESCPLTEGKACRCTLDDARQLGHFRLLHLGGQTGQVYWLLVASDDGAATRYDLLDPLLVIPPAPPDGGAIGGGIREASLVEIPGRSAPLLRIRLTLSRISGVGGGERAEVDWERLCAFGGEIGADPIRGQTPRCSPSLLVRHLHDTHGVIGAPADTGLVFDAALTIEGDRVLPPELGSRRRWTSAEQSVLEADFPGYQFQVLTKSTPTSRLLDGELESPAATAPTPASGDSNPN